MKKITSAVILCAVSFAANAGDACSERLLDKDFITGSSIKDQRAFNHRLICRSEFEEFQQSKGGSASAEAHFIGTTGKASYNKSEYNQYKKESCGGATSDRHTSAMAWHAHRVLSSEAIAGYVACKKNEVFSCWVKPRGDSHAVFVVHRGTGAAKFKTEIGPIIDGNIEVLDNPLPPTSKIPYGSQAVVVRRNDLGAIHFSINVKTQGADDTAGTECEAYVPAVREPSTVSCLNRYNTNLDFDGDGCPDQWVNNNNSLIIELGSGKSFLINLSPTWKTNIGVWLDGDFDGDSKTDLIQVVTNGVDNPDYAHVICKINGRNDYLSPEPFNFREAANDLGDYRVDRGTWSVIDANSDRYSDLQHNPRNDEPTVHEWLSLGNCAEFRIR